MVRTNEGGSVLSFAVVGVILAILLVGGVAAVRQHFIDGQKAAPTPVQVTKTDKKDTAPAPAASDGSQTPANEGQSASGGSPSAPASNTAPAATTPATGDTAPSTTQTTSGGELPHTGPMATFGTIVALSLLTGSGVAYMRSRRALRLLSVAI
jgi:cytoskeletal protein RodZ